MFRVFVIVASGVDDFVEDFHRFVELLYEERKFIISSRPIDSIIIEWKFEVLEVWFRLIKT